MDINKLKCLQILERKQSFNKAAEEANYSVQGFSKVIASMESELGCSLVERTTSGVVFTKWGRACLEHAAVIVGEWEKFKQELRVADDDARFLEEYPVQLFVSPLARLTLLDPLNKSINLNMVADYEVDTQKGLGDILNSGPGWINLFDFPLSLFNLEQLGETYAITPAAMDKIVLVVSKSMRFEVPISQYVDPLPIPMLQTVPLGIWEDETIHTALETVFPRFSLKNVVMRSRTLDSLIGGMAEGRFCMLIPEKLWHDQGKRKAIDIDNFRVMHLPPEFDICYAFVRSRTIESGLLEQRFVDLLVQQISLL